MYTERRRRSEVVGGGEDGRKRLVDLSELAREEVRVWNFEVEPPVNLGSSVLCLLIQQLSWKCSGLVDDME